MLTISVYECYNFNGADFEGVSSDEEACTREPDRVYTWGNNDNYPGCGNCWCCRGIVYTTRLETELGSSPELMLWHLWQSLSTSI